MYLFYLERDRICAPRTPTHRYLRLRLRVLLTAMEPSPANGGSTGRHMAELSCPSVETPVVSGLI